MKNHIGWKIKVLDQAFLRVAESHVGLPATQLRLLGYLLSRENEYTYQKDIESAFSVSRAAVSITLDKMEKSGFLRRVNSEKDKRQKYLVLLDKGRDAAKESFERLVELEEDIESIFSEDEKKLFDDFVTRLLLRMEELNDS